MILRDRNLVSSPLPFLDGPDVDIEVAIWFGRHVRDTGPVWREHRVGVDKVVVGQGVTLSLLEGLTL